MIPLNVTNNSRISIRDDTGILKIKNSEEKDQGRYECSAENSVGTEFSKPALLYVKVRRVPPQITRPPPPINEVALGSHLNLTCVAAGSPMPFVKWRKANGEEVGSDQVLPIGLNTLILTDIHESANYTCIANSSLGLAEAVTQVKVQSLPIQPSKVQVSETTATSVRLSWSYNGTEDVQYYVIQFKPRYANQAFSEISGIITMYYSVRNLSPYTEYEMFVSAVNNIGRGPPSATVTVVTGETGG
ncbi:tyrosine-protein phosphatase Lar-like [Agrilus planipennis]|uniref:protein-tyrosine-phosphatase n=1 Tax=Agrilus planipennis TaxID=224129 RepID=A0A1W4WAI6_AGRPL|nr:tyrosine-protein phosphatase Lar-like [Agrilus planipennis]